MAEKMVVCIAGINSREVRDMGDMAMAWFDDKVQ